MTDLIPVSFDKILQSRTYTMIVLETAIKKFGIYTEPHVGHLLQIYLTEEHKPRPYTHELLKSLLDGFEIKVLQIVINGIEDTIYFSRIFFEQQKGDDRQIVEIDARPSDSITLALMTGAPVFCKKEILDKVIAVED